MRPRTLRTIFILFPIVVGIVGYLSIVYLLPLDLGTVPSSTVVYDRAGIEIGELIRDSRIRHRPVASEDIPDLTRRGIVALEDREFWNEGGISLRGIARSVVHDIQAGAVVEGGSTITAQLVRNSLWLNQPRTFARKLMEMVYAIRLDHMLSKDAVLTTYFDRIYYGYMCYGLDSASQYYFHKAPQNLTPAEQIALLAIPRDPERYDPYRHPQAHRARMEMIIRTLQTQHTLSETDARLILAEPLALSVDHSDRLPYVTDFVGSRIAPADRGANIHTTIDAMQTEQVASVAREVVGNLAWKNVSDYGILLLDRDTMELRVMIGGIDYRTSS